MNSLNPLEGATTTRSIIEILFERAKPNLSKEEMTHLSFATDHAADIARFSAHVTEKLAALLSEDERIGSETSSSQAELLFYLAENFNHIRALTELGDNATSLLHSWDECSAPIKASTAASS